MGIISKEVEVNLCVGRIPYYESLGYNIPRKKDKSGIYRVPKGTTIKVKVGDLSLGSNVFVKVKCDCCNKEYDMQYNIYNKCTYDGIHRCRECYLKWQSGKNHYRWNDNLTDEERENGRNIEGYKDFVKTVMTRDNYTCQCCGNKSSQDLNAHHLDSYDWCVEKRTDPKNGITLCSQCHKNFHLKYGRGNNTKEQFEEWIGYAIEDFKTFDGELQGTKKIYCIEEDKIYDSSFEIAESWGLEYTSSIYDSCNCYRIMIGKLNNRKHRVYSVNGKHLLWYDDYIEMTKEDINQYLSFCKNNSFISVICLTYGEIFETMAEACRTYNITKFKLKKNCMNFGKDFIKSSNGTKLQFMYYDDYLKLQKNINYNIEHEFNKIA